MSSTGLHTLLFVDVDGVLNVGIRDPSCDNPLSLTEPNIRYAKTMWNHRGNNTPSPKDRSRVERIISTCARQLGHGENATYENFVVNPRSGLSDVLVGHLAMLILSIEGRGRVVLSSSWRYPRYAARLVALEEAITRMLGKPFQFDAATSKSVQDNTPGLRLQAIGDFVSEYSEKYCPGSELRVLVLDDFHIEAEGEWKCGETVIDSIPTAECYIQDRAKSYCNITARVIHTYEEFTTDSGLPVQVACGLTCKHLCRARAFVGSSYTCTFCSRMSGLSAKDNYHWQSSQGRTPTSTRSPMSTNSQRAPSVEFDLTEAGYAAQSSETKHVDTDTSHVERALLDGCVVSF